MSSTDHGADGSARDPRDDSGQLGGVAPFVPGADQLAQLGLSDRAVKPPTSDLRFPDGGAWRVEIPSVEGPEALRVVIDTARELEVPLHRVSQGSGVMMLSDAEISEMVALCEEHQIELCLFLGPRASWDTGAQRDTKGGTLVARARGGAALGACIEEALRATRLGVGSLLVADEGVNWSLHQLRESGVLPATTQLKVSINAAPGNPASFRLWEQIGADTVNVPSDLSVAQVAELRGAGSAAIDFYIEAPDTIGGFVRSYDIAEIVRVAAPVYVKFGLRNHPDVYPAGGHLQRMVLDTCAERVRRARLYLDLMHRHSETLMASHPMSAVGSREQAPMRRLSPL